MSTNWEPRQGRNGAVAKLLELYNSPPLPWYIRLWHWTQRKPLTNSNVGKENQ